MIMMCFVDQGIGINNFTVNSQQYDTKVITLRKMVPSLKTEGLAEKLGLQPDYYIFKNVRFNM